MNVRWVIITAAAVAASITLTGCATLAAGTATPNQVAAARAAVGSTKPTSTAPATAERTAPAKPTTAKPRVVKTTVTTTAPPPVVVTVTRTTAAPYPVPVPAPVPDGTASYLQGQVYADSAIAESVTGLWIPQVSSKLQGSQDSSMYAQFTELSARFPDTILVTSGDFSSFTRGGYWVALIARTFVSGEAANAWCDQQQFGPDDCFAKRLSHYDGPAGNSLER